MDWEQLKAQCMACRSCGLCTTRNNVVFEAGDRVVKKGEKAGLYTALDFGSVWLERALAGK